jgi:predicted amidohydrolase YtcJ
MQLRNDLSLRIYGALAVSAGIGSADVARLDQIRGKYPDDPILEIGAADISCGEADASRGGAARPSLDARNEESTCSPEELGRTVTALDEHQWQVVVHPAGKTDARAGIEAFARAAVVNTAPARGRRHRIEDIDAIDPDAVPPAPRIGIIAGPSRMEFPALLSSPGEVSRRSVEAGASVWEALDRAGARIVFGSDWPAASIDPLVGLEAVANPPADPDRSSGDGKALTGLSLGAAIDAYTRHASYASYDELRKGTLAPGMLADIVILSSDVFEGSRERLTDSVVDVTIFDGRIVYQRVPGAADNLD